MFERPLAITLLLIVDLLLSVPVKEFRKCDEVVKFGYLLTLHLVSCLLRCKSSTGIFSTVLGASCLSPLSDYFLHAYSHTFLTLQISTRTSLHIDAFFP